MEDYVLVWGLLICNLILSLSSQEAQTSIIARSSLLTHDSAWRAAGALCHTLEEIGLGQERCRISSVGLSGCAHVTVLKGKASAQAGHFRGTMVMNEGNYRLWERALEAMNHWTLSRSAVISWQVFFCKIKPINAFLVIFGDSKA